MIIENSEYLMRGNRVSPLNFHEVAKLASFFTKILNGEFKHEVQRC